MKARELAQFLLLNPEADVRLYSPLVGFSPYSMEPTDITMNNEANAYVIEPTPRFERDTGIPELRDGQTGPGGSAADLEGAGASAR
jgi:hypothetical protein